MTAERTELRIASRDAELAAWLYRPGGDVDHPCVVMAHGFSLTRHDGLEAYAERLSAGGAAVLVFDHRFLGDSGGTPRQRFRKAQQLEDWHAAVAHARQLPGVDPGRIVLWGFSFSGGHVTTLATRAGGRGRIYAAVLALCPFVNGLYRVTTSTPGLVAWLLPKAFADLAGRQVLIPVADQPGGKAAMTLPGEADGFARAVPPGSPWRNEISPGVFATVALHRPLARAARITCPLWVGLGERDVSVQKRSLELLAQRAPNAELSRYDYDHFDPLVGDAPDRIAADQLGFLQRHGIL
jgi:dienelactone hydrolase